jgi:hypothetical protein
MPSKTGQNVPLLCKSDSHMITFASGLVNIIEPGILKLGSFDSRRPASCMWLLWPQFLQINKQLHVAESLRSIQPLNRSKIPHLLYLMTLSIAQILHGMTGWVMNDKWNGRVSNQSWPNFRHLPRGICISVTRSSDVSGDSSFEYRTSYWLSWLSILSFTPFRQANPRVLPWNTRTVTASFKSFLNDHSWSSSHFLPRYIISVTGRILLYNLKPFICTYWSVTPGRKMNG